MQIIGTIFKMFNRFRQSGFFNRGHIRYTGILLLLGLSALLGGCSTGGTVEMEKTRLLQRVKKNPADVCAWVNLGISHYRLEEYHRAVRAFKKALKIDPKNTDALYSLGLCYHRMGKYDLAIQQYRRLRLIDPDLADKLFKALNPS